MLCLIFLSGRGKKKAHQQIPRAPRLLEEARRQRCNVKNIKKKADGRVRLRAVVIPSSLQSRASMILCRCNYVCALDERARVFSAVAEKADNQVRASRKAM
jgi:predicted component of type VI protein secretion system